MSQAPYPAFIVAARRTAVGRIGGLHRARRLEELTAPIVAAALGDGGIDPGRVDDLILGNASSGGNPARLVALAAGLPDRAAAQTVDRQCASGLDAILSAIRLVASGEAAIVVAGGAESLSTAPWRVARPRSPHQLPHFLGFGGFGSADGAADGSIVDAAETLARECQISRARQDAYAAETRTRALAAEHAGRFRDEIVPLRVRADETRDEALSGAPEADALADLAAYLEPDGTITPGNSIGMHDAAAITVVVSEEVHKAMQRPPALRLVASAATGVRPGAEARAPIEALAKLRGRLNGATPTGPVVAELGETSAAQAIAFRDSLAIDGRLLNPDGGGIARGHPFGATGALLVTRLFTHLVRRRQETGITHGEAVVGTIGGLGVAALFEGA